MMAQRHFQWLPKNGHHNVVEILVKAEADINQTWSGTGATPLFIAAQNGHHKVVEILVKAEADINQAWIGATPLFIAAQTGHPEVVRILVENGANPLLKWKHQFIFSKRPLVQAQYRRPVRLGNLCSDMAKWQRYSTVIEMLKKAEKEWKDIHPPERKSLFYRNKKKNDPVSATAESNPTEQTPPLSVNADFQRLSLSKPT